jgi:hypothetical protein
VTKHKPLTNAERQARHRAKQLDPRIEITRLTDAVAALEKRVARLEASQVSGNARLPSHISRAVMPVSSPAKPVTLASRPMLVKAAEGQAVRDAEQAVMRAWHRQPEHLTRGSPKAKAHEAAVRAGKGHTVRHPLSAALAQARAMAREDFRMRQARQAKQDAGALPDLPPHIARLSPLSPNEARARAREDFRARQAKQDAERKPVDLPPHSLPRTNRFDDGD